MIWKDNSLYVGFFLAIRDLKRSNPWTTSLIILVICLTFFNMLFLNGILIGFARASLSTYPKYFSGDVFIIPSINRQQIEQTDKVISVVKSLPSLKTYSIREVAEAIERQDFPETA